MGQHHLDDSIVHDIGSLNDRDRRFALLLVLDELGTREAVKLISVFFCTVSAAANVAITAAVIPFVSVTITK